MTDKMNDYPCVACGQMVDRCDCMEGDWDAFLWKREHGYENRLHEKTSTKCLSFVGDDVVIPMPIHDSEMKEALLACGEPGRDTTDAVQHFICAYRHRILFDPYWSTKLLESYGTFEAWELKDPKHVLEILIWLTGSQLREQYENMLPGASEEDIYAYFSTY